MPCRFHYNGTSQLIWKYRVQWGVDTVRRWQERWWGSNCWRQWRQNSPTARGFLSPPSPFEKLAVRFAPLWADDVLLDATCMRWLLTSGRPQTISISTPMKRPVGKEHEEGKRAKQVLSYSSNFFPLSSFTTWSFTFFFPIMSICLLSPTYLTLHQVIYAPYLTDHSIPDWPPLLTSPHVRQNRQIGACPLFLEQNVPAFFLLQGI